MLHSIPVEKIGPLAEPMAKAVSTCVHCGFCLPACPTYQTLAEEMDSPRGRIILMKQALEGELPLESMIPYVDRCLGCLGCVTACPSGVQYGDLLTPFRDWAEARRKRTLADRLLRRLVLATLPYPWRFRLAIRFAAVGRSMQGLLPRRLRSMLDLVPQHVPAKETLPEVTPALGARRGRVALLVGCAQQVLAPQINRATIDVLAYNGIEVLVPPAQQCCGALAAHTGALRQAMSHARGNLRAFPMDVDAIVTNAAGCGSGMHEYPLWLKGSKEETAAREFSQRVCDVSAYIDRIGPRDLLPLPEPMKVAYHDACHLSHAQGVTAAPRHLLRLIPNLTLLEVPGGEICCGSAGTYNLEQPEIAADLGRRKAASILATKPDAVATGNIGCMTQIATHLVQAGGQIPVLHTMELLARCLPVRS